MRAVFEVSYRRLVGQLYGVYEDCTEAEEVVAEAFARAVQHQRAFARLDNPEAWLRTVAVNVSRTRRRRARMAAERERAETRHPVLDDKRFELMEALRRLPLLQREVIALHYLADLPANQVAECLGVPTGTVKTRLARGRAALAVLLTVAPDPARRHDMAELDRLLRSDVTAVAAEQAHPGLRHDRAPTPPTATSPYRPGHRGRWRLPPSLPGRRQSAAARQAGRCADLPGRPPRRDRDALRAPVTVVNERAGPSLDPADATDGAINVRQVDVGRARDAEPSEDFARDLAESHPGEGRLDALGRVIEYGVVIDADGDLQTHCPLGISNENDTAAEPVDSTSGEEPAHRAADGRVGRRLRLPVRLVHPEQESRMATPRMQFSFLNGRQRRATTTAPETTTTPTPP